MKENTSQPILGVAYDLTEYHITVKVKDDGFGKLVSDVEIQAVIHGQSHVVNEIVFENHYSLKNAVVFIKGEKILKGATLKNEMFTFKLYETDEKFHIYGNALYTTKNLTNGSFAFGALTYDCPGIYYYAIVEDSSMRDEHIVYDESIYHVKVIVEEGQNHQLIAKSIITKDGQPVDKIVFENMYELNEEDVCVNIPIRKVVKNRGSKIIGPENFSFVLTNLETNEQYMTKSDQDGLALLTLVLTNEDVGQTDHYRLTEIPGCQEGMTYSHQVYDFEIAVTLNEHHLMTTLIYQGEQRDDFIAEFVNIYDSDKDASSGSLQRPNTGDDQSILIDVVSLLVSALMIVFLHLRKRVDQHKKK